MGGSDNYPDPHRGSPKKAIFGQTLCATLQTFDNDMATLFTLLSESSTKSRELLATVTKHKLEKEGVKDSKGNAVYHNIEGSFMGLVCQLIEDRILNLMDIYLTERGFEVDVLCFDGLMVVRQDEHPKFPASILLDVQKHIQTKLDFNIILLEKSLEPNEEDMKMFRDGPLRLSNYHHDKNVPVKQHMQFHYLTLKLCGEAYRHGYIRYGNTVRKKHATIKGVFVEHCTIPAFVNQTLQDEPQFAGKMKRLVDWCQSQNHHLFPRFTDDMFAKDHVSFENGRLTLSTMEFEEWTNIEHPESQPNWHFFEMDYDEKRLLETPTPLWDSILAYQLPPEQIDILTVLIGRLFFPVGFDGFEVMPFIQGIASTGKGSIVKIVRAMFPAGSVATVSESRSETFGLASAVGKRLLACEENPEFISKCFTKTDFQKMVSGEALEANVKFGDVIEIVKWTTPLLFAGNHFLDYKDSAGSIVRRVVRFVFEKMVQAQDFKGHLVKDVIRDELVAIMVKCLVKYHRFRKEHDGKQFYGLLPPSMQESQNDISHECNPLSNFINNGDDYHQIIYEEGSITLRSQLDDAYSKHCQYTLKKPHLKLGTDSQPIEVAGYSKVNVHVCKICSNRASKEACGGHFNPKARVKKIGYKNMKIIRLTEERPGYRNAQLMKLMRNKKS
jgi:hypothetical protein